MSSPGVFREVITVLVHRNESVLFRSLRFAYLILRQFREHFAPRHRCGALPSVLAKIWAGIEWLSIVNRPIGSCLHPKVSCVEGKERKLATLRQKRAAKKNVKKAAAAAKKQRTIAHLPKSTRTALGKKGASVAKKKPAARG